MKRKITISALLFVMVLVTVYVVLIFDIKNRFSDKSINEYVDSGFSAVWFFDNRIGFCSYDTDENINYTINIKIHTLKGKADLYVIQSITDTIYDKETVISKFENNSEDLKVVKNISIEEGEISIDLSDNEEGTYFLLITSEAETVDGEVTNIKLYSKGYEEYCKLNNQYFNMADKILSICRVPFCSYKESWDKEKNN